MIRSWTDNVVCADVECPICAEKVIGGRTNVICGCGAVPPHWAFELRDDELEWHDLAAVAIRAQRLLDERANAALS